MKIEFIKETKVNGDEMFYTKVNDSYIDKSLSFDQGIAKKIYDNIVANKGKIDFKEVLESVEIEEAK